MKVAFSIILLALGAAGCTTIEQPSKGKIVSSVSTSEVSKSKTGSLGAFLYQQKKKSK